ncbi:hypothetical protein B0H19DRAFT_1250724 [Mycena capillaripes]|nr:hypothetical protein B0H19DRAFT_1250724 [Mycena capillaripes]
MRAFAMQSVGIFALISALLVPFTFAVPIVDQVLAPGGYRSGANMMAVPLGGRLAHVGSDIHVMSANGTVVHIATPKPRPSKSATAVSPEQTGWITFASWLNNVGVPIGSFGTNWIVPPVPASQHGQTIFLFNSIEPGTFDGIMQPVLQYGPSAAGGGAFWAVATWYLLQDQTFFTTPVRVNPGQNLRGALSLVGGSGTTFNYHAGFTNVAGTELDINGSPQLEWATLTLEAYGVTTASDYPSGSTAFTSVGLELTNGARPAIGWSTVNDAPDGLSTTINVGGSVNAVVTIKY